MTSQDFRNNQLRSSNSDLYQNLDNADIDGGMQALQGDGNTQILGQVLTFNHTEITQISVDKVKSQEFIESSPYKGLKTFESDDQDIFFGRSQFITSLVDQLEKSNLVLLLGASGSGKSSVVRAGLIPWLSQKWHPRFVKFILTPDKNPFLSLHSTLLYNKYKQSEAEIALEAKADTLNLVIQKLKKFDEYWLILIDQFEELFTLSQPEKRERFIEGLVKFNQTKQNSVKIVATMRADFMDKLSPYGKLITATDKHRPMIAEMEVDELRLAIEQPAAHRGVVFESGLVDEIIKNIQGQKGYLPLLQYTLNLLWETELKNNLSQERTLNISTYHQLGRVQGALQQHVDAIYNSLSKEKQLAVKRIFLRLVDIGEDVASGSEWKPVRRRASKSVFSSKEEQDVLLELINKNLLVSDLSPENQESTIDITHEILLTSWTTLNDWIKENREAIAIRNRLNNDMKLWKTKKSEDELWSGSKLEQVLELRINPTFNQVLGGFSQEENEFIELSVGLRERKRQRTLIALTSFSVFALILAAFAGWQWRLADASTKEAIRVYSESLFEQGRKSDSLIENLRIAIPFRGSLFKPPLPIFGSLVKSVYTEKEYKRLEDHTGSIGSLKFSHNRKMLASGSDDGTIKIRDAATGKLIKSFTAHQTGVISLAFSHDDKIIASGGSSDDNMVKLWDVATGKLIKTFPRHKLAVVSIAFSHDSKILASGSGDKTLKFWDVNKGKEIRSFIGDQKRVITVAFSRDSKILASGGADGNIKLWDVAKGKLIKSFLADSDRVISLAFSPDNKTLASGSADTRIKIWDFNTKKPITQPLKTLIGHHEWVRAVVFSRDGKMLVSSSDDKTIKLWDVATEKEIKTFTGHTSYVSALALSDENKTIASGSFDKTIRLWNLTNKLVQRLTNHKDRVNTVAFSPDSKLLVSGSADQNIKLWDVTTGKLITTLPKHHSQSVRTVVFSPDGKILASSSEDKKIKLWDVKKGQEIRTLTGHKDEVRNVAFSPDNKILASSSGSEEKMIKLWNIANGKEIKTLPGHTDGVSGIAFSPDGKMLASGSGDKTVKLWNVATGNEIKTFKGHINWITSVAFSPNGKMIASGAGTGDNSIKLWDVATGKEIKTFKHTKWVKTVAFSPDGKMIVSGSGDHSIKLWDVDTGKEIATLNEHKAPIQRVAFSRDGKTLASGSDDKTIILWNLDFNDLVKQGCQQVHEYLQTSRNVPENDRKLCDGIVSVPTENQSNS